MTLHIIKPKWLAAAALTTASAALFACSTATVTSTASVPPSSATPVASSPDPTSTPVPELVLITGSDLAWESDLAAWATQAGLNFTVVNPSGASAYLSESQPHVAAVVSDREALGGDLQQLAIGGIPIVTVNVPGIEPGASLSTVGNARRDQAGFLAGVMTGLSSQTGWVGQVTATGGPNEQAYSAGFTQGLLYGCPKCQMISQTASDMTMDRFRANSVDVVFIFPGTAAGEAAQVLAEGNLPMVWVGENGPPGEALVGRLIIYEGSLIIPALEELIATGEGQAWQPSIQSSTVIPIDINAEFLSPGRQRLFDEAYGAIAAEALDIGTDLDE